jgi:hypothetical protein
MVNWLREKLALGFMFLARQTDYDAFMTMCEVVVVAEHIEEIRFVRRLEQEHDYEYNNEKEQYDDTMH